MSTREDTRVADARARDLRSEAHLRALGFWFQVDGLIAVALSLFGLLSLSFGSDHPDDGPTRATLLLVLLAWSTTWSVGANLLYRLRERGRVTTMLMYLLGTLAGIVLRAVYHASALAVSLTLLGAAFQLSVLMTLFSPRAAHVCAPDYQQLVERTPGLRPQFTRSPFFVVYAVLHGLALIVALRALVA
jgi:hypothetical protein